MSEPIVIHIHQCHDCDGRGRKPADRRWDGIAMESVPDTYRCPKCQGRGTIPDTAAYRLDRAISLHDLLNDPAPPT